MTWLITLILLGPTEEAKPLSPADAVKLAAADLQTIDPTVRPFIRYLSLAAVPAKDREKWQKVLAYHVNALSTESDVVAPTTCGQGHLLRLNIRDYAWDQKVWEQLAEQEPYFHVRLTAGNIPGGAAVWWPGGQWDEYGKNVPAGLYRMESCKTAIIAFAPWLSATDEDRKTSKFLIEGTQSGCPLVDGRWFLWQTALQTARKPGYYDFLGIKTKADFDALVGLDKKFAEKAKRVELLEAVAISIITKEPRRIGAFAALEDRAWETFDNEEGRAVDQGNPLRVLNGGLKFNAQECIGFLPNKLLAFGLFVGNDPADKATKEGDKADAAPQKIVRTEVEVNIDCIKCHGPHGGFQPVDGWARGLFKGPLALQSPDYEKLKELRQKYLRDLDWALQTSRSSYALGTKAVCGLEVKELSSIYGSSFDEYNGPVYLERAARDVGLDPEVLKNKLLNYVKTAGDIDTVAAKFVTTGGIGVRQWHEAFAPTMLAVQGQK